MGFFKLLGWEEEETEGGKWEYTVSKNRYQHGKKGKGGGFWEKAERLQWALAH